MKKVLSCALALTITASMFAVPAFAEDEQTVGALPAVVGEGGEEAPEAPVEDYAEGDFYISSDGAITNYTGSEENVVIPDKVAGITVTAIGNNSPGQAPFRFNKTIKTVSIPDTVTNINAYGAPVVLR